MDQEEGKKWRNFPESAGEGICFLGTFRSWRCRRESEPTGRMQTCVQKGGFLLMTQGVTFINHSLDRQWEVGGWCPALCSSIYLVRRHGACAALPGPKLCSEHPEIRLPGSWEK